MPILIGLLTKGLEWTLGPVAKWVLVAGGAVIVLWLGATWMTGRAERKAEAVCVSRLEKVRAEELARAAEARARMATARAESAMQLLEVERTNADQLATELERVRRQAEQLTAAASSNDSLCVSPGFLQRLRGGDAAK